MRFILPVSLALLALATLTVPTGCIPAECNATCESTVTINAHVPGSPAALTDAQITFCRNGVCASTKDGEGPLTGAPFSAHATVAPEIDGFTVVGITMDASEVAAADGDTYSVTIVGAAGTKLLGVTRPVTYEISHGCGTTCQSYSTDVYPTSASGVACATSTCDAGPAILGALRSTDTNDPVVVSVCRNGTTCGVASIGLPVGVSDGLEASLSGALVGTLGMQELSDNSPRFDFQVTVKDDAAALHDGDTYTVTAKQGSTTLTNWTGSAPYKTSIQSLECDPYACRSALIDTTH